VTLLAVGSCLFCQLCLVAGQLMLKRAMTGGGAGASAYPAALPFAGGISLLSLWFFLWLGLLRDWELTRVFPFEAVSPLLLALGAWLFLKEKLSALAWLGIALIGIGVTLVAGG
jgi:undecaprenyl phosphate-alpha-L-ara4N flippase subunit ArnE